MILVTFLVLKTAFFLHPFPEWFFLQLTSHGQNSVAILTCCHDLFGCKERYKALLPVSHSKLRQAALWQVGLALYFHANTNEVVLLWKWEGCLKCGDVLVGFFFFFGEGYFAEIDVPYQSIQCTLNYNNFVTLSSLKKKLSCFWFFDLHSY